MDFRELQYITTIADCGSVTAAARKLFISQPSLSTIVSRIEQDIGVKLFDRRTSPLTLTYAGEKYVETARRILLLNDNLRRELVDIGLGEKGRITFGIPSERTGYMLPRVMPEFKRMFPQVEVHIVEAMSEELFAALSRDEINFFIVPHGGRDIPPELTCELVYREPLDLVVAPGSVSEEDFANPEKKRVSPAFLQRQPFILIKRGHSIRQKTDALLRDLGVVPDISIEVSSCISAVQLADSGLGITIVPHRALESLGGAGRFCCLAYTEEPVLWDVNIVYKKDAYLDRAERCFIDLMKKVFTQ